jgi:hypothetical protein
MKCGVCGKEMGDGDRNLIAVSISFEAMVDGWDDLAKRQFGSFDPSRKYVLCYECWLLSLGFRPTTRAADLLPCGHHKDALVENAGRQWCVACEMAASR